MALHRKIPWFPLILAGVWLAMTSLAIRDMNALAMSLAPLAAQARPTPRAAPATTIGFSEEIEVVVCWRGGVETRHEVYQGLRRTADLAGFETLRTCVTELRGQGKTGEQIAQTRAGRRVSRGVHRRRSVVVGSGGASAPHAADLAFALTRCRRCCRI